VDRWAADRMALVGLGGAPSEWADYEWFRLEDVVAGPPAGDGLLGWARTEALWTPDGGRRVLLADLDNLRAGPRRLRERIGLIAALAAQADVAAFAGQAGAVARSRPWLGDFADRAVTVTDGPDVADWALLDIAAAIPDGPTQFVVASNDGIFAELAQRGRLVVLSPGSEALSDRLVAAADLVVDLVVLEEGGAQPSPPARARPAPSRRSATGRRRGPAGRAAARG